MNSAPVTFTWRLSGDRPSSSHTDTFRRSPPDTSRNLERLTQT
ncbi:hypothetical protein [Thermoleptolyngbya sp.]